MKKNLILLAVSAALLVSCGTARNQISSAEHNPAVQQAPAAAPQTPAVAVPRIFSGEKTVVLGDSYSTFEGCIPDGYACWYFPEEGKGNDVHKASQTWWSLLCKAEGLDLLLDSSYSGSTIGNTGYDGKDYSDRSFVTRMKIDIVREDGSAGRCGEIPELLLIFGGTNDDWSHAPLGSVLPKTDWRGADLYKSFPAASYMLGYLTEKLPDTRIVMIINSDMTPEVEAGLEEVSRTYGVEYVKLSGIDKIKGHPSVAGMVKIAEELGEALK